MSMILNPYLSFRDNAREAMEFYREVFGGELAITTFGEYRANEEVDEQDLVMHAQLECSGGFTLMASDTPKAMEYSPGTNISVSISGSAESDGELRGYWERLTAGARVDMPLESAPWGNEFGMLTDRFGIAWMVSIAPADG